MGTRFGTFSGTGAHHAGLGLLFILMAIQPLSPGLLRAEKQARAAVGPGLAANAALRVVDTAGTRAVDGVVIVKFKGPVAIPRGMSLTGLPSLDKILTTQGAVSIERAFPLPHRALGPGGRELQRIFRVRYRSGANPREVALRIARDPNVEYAVPQYVHRISDLGVEQPLRSGRRMETTPNDSLYTDMSHLPHVKAPTAWDVVKGEDGDVIIAVVDGGTDWQHEDLLANVWTNSAELNGVPYVDDDGNGYVDDVHGWNFANDSGNPAGLPTAPDNERHGTAVAGVASAVTNNLVGIAGASWNARLMPINTTCESDTFICYGYEGIIYAAENGADVINASWGSSHAGITPFEERLLLRLVQDITDFVVERGALLVSSAGNDGVNSDEVLFLPAGAPHVLAAGATSKAGDTKAYFSNYGLSVDVFAPGVSLNTTAPGHGYTDGATGTSFSAPLAAGIAALVKTRFPGLSPDQLAQQVRVTAEPIDDANDPIFSGLLGKGRIDAYRAVTDTTIPAIRIVGTSFRDSGQDGVIESGETVDLQVTLTNYLADAAGVAATLTLDDPNVTITSADAGIGSLPSGDTVDVDFQFTLSEVGENYPLRFILEIGTDSYQDRELIRLSANEPLVLAHDTGQLRVSITTEGNIGWTGFADASLGEGFVYDGTNLLFEGGLLVGVSENKVSDCIRGVNEVLEQDFGMPPGEQLLILPGQVANEEGTVVLTDHLASWPLGVTIRQESYADNQSDYDDFVIFSYTITNSSGQSLSNLYAGLFFDWDINEDAQDFARFDQERLMGIVQNSPSAPTSLAATRLLTRTGELSFRAIDNLNEIYGGDAGNGFTTVEKWSYLSGGLQRTRLDNVDVSTLTAVGPFAVDPGQSVEVAFAVIGAGSQQDLKTNADNAQDFWDTFIMPAQLNHPPVFTRALPDTTIYAGETLTFDYAAEDVDDDDLTFRLVDPPGEATLDSVTGRLTFQTAADFEGAVVITATVSDGVFSSAARAEITVEKIVALLTQNNPNPFSLSREGETSIEYHLAEPGDVLLVVYDLLGREVKTLVNEKHLTAGEHTATWNARDNRGRRVSTGIYLYRIQSGDFIETRKLVVLK